MTSFDPLKFHKLYHPFKIPTTWQIGVHRSPPLTLFGLTFKIRVNFIEEDKGAKKIVGVFLECTREAEKSGASHWSCGMIEGMFRVVGKVASDSVEYRCTPYTYTSFRSTWGYPNMINWNDVIGAKFLQEEHVHIEIKFRLEAPVGLDFTGEKLESAGKSHLSFDFLALYESGEGTDIVLKSKHGHEFPCHQLILSARSPVFKAMFQHEMKEKAEGAVVMKEMGGESLTMFCTYLYAGNLAGAETDFLLKYELDMWKELVKAADMYELHHLTKLAAHALVLRKKPENAWEIMCFLKQFPEEKMADPLGTIKQYIMHNVKDVLG